MIDGGPARTGRSSDRQPTYRPEAVRSQSEPSAPTERILRDPSPIRTQPPEPSPRKKVAKGLVIGLIILVVVMLLAAASYFLLPGLRGQVGSEISDDKYQAVFLASGQVYFGDLSIVDGDYIKLSGVFYIQSGDEAAQAEDSELPANASGMQLIKLGEEVHGPEDAMIINNSQVLFFENLKSDGSVAQLIDQYKQNN